MICWTLFVKNVFSKCWPRKIAKFCGFKANFYTCFDPKYISKYAPDCITDHPNLKLFRGSMPRTPSQTQGYALRFQFSWKNSFWWKLVTKNAGSTPNMRRAGSLCRDPGTLVKSNKNRVCDYRTTEPARLAGIPVLLCRVDPGWKFSKESRLSGGPSNEPSEKQDSR